MAQHAVRSKELGEGESSDQQTGMTSGGGDTRTTHDHRIGGEEGRTRRICPECNGAVAAEQTERVCTDCGLVVGTDRVDPGPEWRSYEDDESQTSRIGGPVTELHHLRGFDSIMDINRDVRGRKLDTASLGRYKRLKRWNKRVKASNRERTLRRGLAEIKRMGSALNIAKEIREMAGRLYRNAVNNNLLPGRSVEGVATACLYAVCRIKELPRTLGEMVHVSKLTERQRITGTYKKIIREFNLSIPIQHPAGYVSRYLSDLANEHEEVAANQHEIRRKAEQLLKTGFEAGTCSGCSPQGLCAGAIYFVASEELGLKLSQATVSDICNVCIVTVRERYNDLAENSQSLSET